MTKTGRQTVRHCALYMQLCVYPSYRSGCITVEELRTVCDGLGTPMTDCEVSELLKE